MPRPLLQHVNAVLSNILFAYMQDEMAFVSRQVFPAVPVDKDSDFYYTFAKDTFLRDAMERRGDNEESEGTGFDVSTDTYRCDVWATHVDQGQQMRARIDDEIRLDTSSTRICGRRALLRQERQWVTDYFAGGIWGTTVTGAVNFTVWSDPTSDPEADVSTGRVTILQNTGYEPNRMVVGYNVFQALKRHPLIKDQFKYTSPENITASMLAAYFEVERFLVSKSVYVNSIAGAATMTTAFTHGNHALLCYSANAPAIMEPSAGYTFEWTGVSGGLNGTTAVDAFDIRERGTRRVEAQVAFDHKVCGTDLGYFFASAV